MSLFFFGYPSYFLREVALMSPFMSPGKNPQAPSTMSGLKLLRLQTCLTLSRLATLQVGRNFWYEKKSEILLR